MSNLVLLHEEDGVTTITLNRPEQVNALNEEMLNVLATKLKEASENDSKIIVLQGNGKAFSAGGDLNMIASADNDNAFSDIMNIIEQIVLTLYQMPKITIAALNGSAAGLGLSLALGCDYVLAKSDAKIAMNFIGIGLIPDGAGHFMMQQRVGTVRAKHLIWEGKKLEANEAKGIGLIDFVITSDLDQSVKQYTDKLKNSPILAMIQTKTIYHQQQLDELKSILAAETTAQTAMRKTNDHHEGVDAFLNKRQPDFKWE
ncbi:enoyl-CoA hydratase/carnithine racemase [Alkalibacillus flavidus]|uniref:Enoyl-CoA hydratase/carnithine racemase n=1 Tax=Alkalibacillus flavidus TaxID=546021 RepID=A0ABV2KWF0_9BACI